LDHFISLPFGFLTVDLGFHILGTPVGSKSFVELFVAKAIHEDLEMIFSLLMLVDLQVGFAMLLLCYAQCPSYLLCTMFPSLGILQHYTKFNIHTIVMLENLSGARSFGGFNNHIIHR
jgi:hypothetical protein